MFTLRQLLKKKISVNDIIKQNKLSSPINIINKSYLYNLNFVDDQVIIARFLQILIRQRGHRQERFKKNHL